MSDYIPPELIPNILARLPVEDVLRCTSVCKLWYEVITCHSFASLHLNRCSRNQEPRLLLRYYRKDNLSYYLHRDNQTFDKIAVIESPCAGSWRVVDCINGLFCFFDVPSGKIMLWNPSLRKSVVSSLKTGRLLRKKFESYDHSVGFGFVATSNEYKIVRFSYDHTDGKHVADIYQLSTGSWHLVKLDDCPFVDAGSRQAHLNGILHWFSYKRDPALICAFDLKNEKFSALMVPSCLQREYGSSFKLCTLRDSLCLIHWTNRDKICNIWFMKEYGEPDSWEKLFSIDKKQHSLYSYSTFRTFPIFRHSEELLFGAFCDDSCYGKLVLLSYDRENNKVKNLGLLYSSHYRPTFSAYQYVESLVLMKLPKKANIYQESTKISMNMQGLLLNGTNETGNGSKT